MGEDDYLTEDVGDESGAGCLIWVGQVCGQVIEAHDGYVIGESQPCFICGGEDDCRMVVELSGVDDE